MLIFRYFKDVFILLYGKVTLYKITKISSSPLFLDILFYMYLYSLGNACRTIRNKMVTSLGLRLQTTGYTA